MHHAAALAIRRPYHRLAFRQIPRFDAPVRTLFRWLGYVLISLGLALFLASYVMTYLRGGFSAIASRFINPFGDAFLLMVCVAPGLLLVGAANR
jgi:hypothetical protein